MVQPLHLAMPTVFESLSGWIRNSDCLLDSKLGYTSFSGFVGKNVEAGFPEGEDDPWVVSPAVSKRTRVLSKLSIEC